MAYQKKQQVNERLEAARAAIREYRQSCNQIQCDPDLTAQGKEKRAAEELRKLEQKCKGHLNEAARMIREVRFELERAQNANTRKADDVAHQLRLANAIKALELRGRAMTSEEIAELVKPLAHDRLAKMTLLAAAQAGGRDPWRAQNEFDDLFGEVQDRSETVKRLRELEDFIRGMWDHFGVEIADLSTCFTTTAHLDHFDDTLTRWK